MKTTKTIQWDDWCPEVQKLIAEDSNAIVGKAVYYDDKSKCWKLSVASDDDKQGLVLQPYVTGDGQIIAQYGNFTVGTYVLYEPVTSEKESDDNPND